MHAQKDKALWYLDCMNLVESKPVFGVCSLTDTNQSHGVKHKMIAVDNFFVFFRFLFFALLLLYVT